MMHSKGPLETFHRIKSTKDAYSKLTQTQYYNLPKHRKETHSKLNQERASLCQVRNHNIFQCFKVQHSN